MTHISAAVYIWPVNVTALIDDFLSVCVERDRSTLFFFFSFFLGSGDSDLAFSYPISYPISQNHKSHMQYAFDFVRKWILQFQGRKVISGVFIQVLLRFLLVLKDLWELRSGQVNTILTILYRLYSVPAVPSWRWLNGTFNWPVYLFSKVSKVQPNLVKLGHWNNKNDFLKKRRFYFCFVFQLKSRRWRGNFCSLTFLLQVNKEWQSNAILGCILTHFQILVFLSQAGFGKCMKSSYRQISFGPP